MAWGNCKTCGMSWERCLELPNYCCSKCVHPGTNDEVEMANIGEPCKEVIFEPLEQPQEETPEVTEPMIEPEKVPA